MRRDIEQAAAALAFAAVLHERLDAQRRLFADFPRVMEQLRSGALERVATALARLFEGKDQFDLTRFVRDLPLALAQLAAAEAARKGAPSSPPPAAKEAAASPAAAPNATSEAPAGATEAKAEGSTEANPDTAAAAADSVPPSDSTREPEQAATGGEAPANVTDVASGEMPTAASVPAGAPLQETAPASAASTNGGSAPEPPSPRVELRGRLLAAAPQLGRAVVTYRRTVMAVRRAAAPRRAPGPWRSDREVLEDAKLAVDFARQLFDAYAEAWADQPTQAGLADGMSAETDRFLAWTQLARYMEVAAPRSQPPPEKPGEKPAERPSDKQPVTQGSSGAGGATAEGEPAHG
ncbi:MAG TPA: hypothetical protein VG496_00600 [Myxococcales bacterium]|nr:hypothetical protein [Myxococcales bacterium]